MRRPFADPYDLAASGGRQRLLNVSVIIPCYNAAAYLGQAIGSVLEQSLPPFEIIFVDDGSTDDSLEVALAFGRVWGDRVKVLSERCGRASRARNLGASIAAGDALMFLDADDVLGPTTLEALSTALRHRPEGVAVCPWYRLVHRNDRWVHRPRSCAPRGPRQDALSAWLTGWYHPPCSVLWSGAAFERAGRWDDRWNPNDDGDLMMRALAFGVPVIETDRGAGYYRRMPEGEASLSGRRSTREGVEARMDTIRKVAYLLEGRGLLPAYRAAVSEAFRIVGASAEGRHPDLHELAEAEARRFASPSWSRMARRIRSVALRSGRHCERVVGAAEAGSGGERKAAENEEITFGVSSAERVRSDRSAPQSSPAAVRLELERPAVSIIIPTFDRAHVLPRAIESVLGQSFEDFELLVVDDGSTDDTAATVTGFADDRVRYVREPKNRGVGAARNRGLRESRADLIAFLDSDDEWLPEKLARQVDLMSGSSDRVGLVYTGVESVFGDGSTKIARPTVRGNAYERMLVTNAIHGGGSNVVIRRTVVPTIGFFDETFAAIEDYDYWLRVARFFEIDYIADPLIRYYDVRTEQRAQSRKSLALRDNLAARRHLYEKHRPEMRRAGVSHLFLVESARRHLIPSCDDVNGARRNAVRAFFEAPTSFTVHKMLQRAFLPPALHRLLAKGWHAIRRPSGT